MLSEAAVFASVFPAAALSHSTPTPLSTPIIGSSAPGLSFGALTSPQKHKKSQSLSPAELQVKRNIAWSTATRFLALTGLIGDELQAAEKHGTSRRPKTREVEEALEFLLSGDGPQGQTDEEWDLVNMNKLPHSQSTVLTNQIEWYILEVRTHFLENVAPGLQQAWSKVSPTYYLLKVQQLSVGIADSICPRP